MEMEEATHFLSIPDRLSQQYSYRQKNKRILSTKQT